MRLKRRQLFYRPTRPTRLLVYFFSANHSFPRCQLCSGYFYPVSVVVSYFFPVVKSYCFSDVVGNVFQKLKVVFCYSLLHIFLSMFHILSIMIQFSHFILFSPQSIGFQLYFCQQSVQFFLLCSSVVCLVFFTVFVSSLSSCFTVFFSSLSSFVYCVLQQSVQFFLLCSSVVTSMSQIYVFNYLFINDCSVVGVYINIMKTTFLFKF